MEQFLSRVKQSMQVLGGEIIKFALFISGFVHSSLFILESFETVRKTVHKMGNDPDRFNTIRKMGNDLEKSGESWNCPKYGKLSGKIWRFLKPSGKWEVIWKIRILWKLSDKWEMI